jgi:branched-subunit amino acid transport protein
MSTLDAWILVFAAVLVLQALRCLPMVLLRWRTDDLPAPLVRALNGAGAATLAGLLALAVFHSSPAVGAGPPAVEPAGKLAALVVAFVLQVWLRRGTAAVVLAWGFYVLFTLTVR